jgi:hypothetical protein
VASHKLHPRRLALREPPARLLRPPAPRESPARPLRALATPPTLRPSATSPHRSKPQERPPVGVWRSKYPVNKNNDKIYQMKQ